MNTVFLFWIIIAILFLIAELGSPGLFFFFSFFLGALATAITSFFVVYYTAQLLVFLSGTMLAFFVMQKWVKARTGLSQEQKTNVDALKGKHAIVTTSIGQNTPGYISIQGVLWLARSADNAAIEKDSWVEIVDVCGAHLRVKKINNK